MFCVCVSDDVIAAIRKLKALGSGFTLIPIGSRYLVQSVPGELTMDHATILEQAEVGMAVIQHSCSCFLLFLSAVLLTSKCCVFFSVLQCCLEFFLHCIMKLRKLFSCSFYVIFTLIG